MADTHDHGVTGQPHSHGDGVPHSHGVTDTPHSHGGDTPPHSHGDAHPDMFKAYMVVAVALAIFTGASFIFNYLAHPEVAKITREMSFILILSVAVCKALLVGTYFMHLKFDWSRLYFLIIPAFILGFMMMIVLLPDIVFVWSAK